MRQARIIAANGMLGTGLKAESLETALNWGADVIGCDAGSTDPGPYFLATGGFHFSVEAMKRDLRIILKGARAHKVPFILGSAGTGGTDIHLEKVVGFAKEIAKEEGLHFRMGIVHSEQNKDYLISMFRKGKIKPLRNAPELTEEHIKKSLHIVGMAGIEPYIECLDNGADVILAGRSSDTSIYAAVPMRMGLPPGPVWHAAKTMECGTACTANVKYSDCVYATVDEKGFTIKVPSPDMVCTPTSIASHMVYENASPYELIEPSGILDVRHARYTAIDDRSVRVEGSEYRHKPYTIKLEGAELAGYHCLAIGGVRDPLILKQLDKWLDLIKGAVAWRCAEIFGKDADKKCRFNIRVYGRNAVMGPLEPDLTVGHEVGLILEVLADTEELSHGVLATACHIALHAPIPEWEGLISGTAYPYSPYEINRGPMYKFNMHHVVEPDSYKDMFRIEYVNL
jgi:Acyclic terpene utilisation family protein AtuA